MRWVSVWNWTFLLWFEELLEWWGLCKWVAELIKIVWVVKDSQCCTCKGRAASLLKGSWAYEDWGEQHCLVRVLHADHWTLHSLTFLKSNPKRSFMSRPSNTTRAARTDKVMFCYYHVTKTYLLCLFGILNFQ